MNEQDTFHKIALSQLHGIKSIRLTRILSQLNDYQDIFTFSNHELWLQTGVNKSIISSLNRGNALKKAALQMRYNEKHEIITSFFLDSDFPRRLKQCSDTPVVLYSKGKFNWNQQKVLAIVGTRNPTEYGRDFLENLLNELKADDILIVSGLAYGIDAHAHSLCLAKGISTLGVLGHGIDRVYPSNHKMMAHEMLHNGGLLTEFMIGTKPDRENFPMRNRIVAGLSDATLVIESKEKGGSIITAELAFDYNREVFALPGDVNRLTSKGCNNLIRKGIAHILESAEDIRFVMNWEGKSLPKQQSIDFVYDEVEKVLIDLIDFSPTIHIDTLHMKSGIPFTTLQGTLLQLELKDAICKLPGNRWAIHRKNVS
ncbi:MAG: hypothetical protein RL037_1021 [Bacteroidota bacterium]